MNEISRKILFVDDDENFVIGLKRRLGRKFDITFALSGQAGLRMLRVNGPFAVVISDYAMPEMNGVEFLQQAHHFAPDAVKVMLTGVPNLDLAISALHEGHIYRFLSKPCLSELLERTLDDCLEQYRLVMAERMLVAELSQANQELRILNVMLEKEVA